MPSLVRHITVDCAEPYWLAEFWSEVTGHRVHPDDSPTDTEVLVDMPEGMAGLLFVQVPEGKRGEPTTDRRSIGFGDAPSGSVQPVVVTALP